MGQVNERGVEVEFRIDRVYKLTRIKAESSAVVYPKEGILMAKVESKRPGRIAVVFEFVRVSGAKWKCFGVGRFDRVAHHFPESLDKGNS